MRLDNGLPRLDSRMAAISDSLMLSQDALASDAIWVTGEITISTSHGQTAIAPGKMTKTWVENGRPYYKYVVETPMPFNWHIGSAKHELFRKGEINGIIYSIFADKDHLFNIQLYENALKKGIQFYSNILGRCPINEIGLVEINHWNEPFASFANTIAISEKEGWLADTTNLTERAYLYLTIGSQLAEQWLLPSIPVANVQGADMLKTALPEAIGLHFVNHHLGENAVSILIEKKLDQYGRGRNNEPNSEPVLLYADGADYLEINKGAVALYRVIQDTGWEKFGNILKRFSEKRRYCTFYEMFQELQPFITKETEEMFTKVSN